MKNKFTVPMIILVLHFLICTFLSLEWPFLEGIYMGFFVTLLMVWAPTFPLVIACITLVGTFVKVRKNNKKLGNLDCVSIVTGCLVLLIYISSACGLLKNELLSLGYISIFIGAVIMAVCWIISCSKKR